MTTPEENKKMNIADMLNTINNSIDKFNLALKQHQPNDLQSIIHIKGQLVDIPNKRIGADPTTIQKYSRQYARKMARKIKNGNGDVAEQMNFKTFCLMALSNLEKLKQNIEEMQNKD